MTSHDFDTVLVANRGEIALRVFRTARAMGLRTVAVHSEADAGMPHVLGADRAVCIGPAAAAASYLNVERILDAARRTGAQAIHPGYGFLSESDAFASACRDAGLVFIGPTPEAIRAMGNKATAKAIMLREQVPCIPGYDGAQQDDAVLAEQAQRIGYPVMVKAVAGGGGKGMRLVDSAAQLPDALRAARSEALKSFGNGALMLEKAIVRPRHVEVQVFGDAHGQVIHLGDRDCSIQRRHQKVIEEAPAPGLDGALRERMGEAAVRAARAVGYQGAGTVEFLVTPDGGFYFLEMNTRLQVEHPVTEMVTGIDLVEWQIRVARGEPLPLAQEQVRVQGHAIEVRVYAEDPCAGFLPQTGRLSVWQPPEGEGIRVDAGLAQGCEVSTSYDPLMAKVIAAGADRELARRRLIRALERFAVGGLRNNLHFLGQCLRHPGFSEVRRLDTGFLDRERIDVEAAREPDPRTVAIAAALWQARGLARVDASLRHWHSRPWPAEGLALECGTWQGALQLTALPDRGLCVKQPDGTAITVDLPGGEASSSVVVDGVRETVHWAWTPDGLDLVRGDRCFAFSLARRAAEAGTRRGAAVVSSPMPGSIAEMRVSEGALVAAGDVLLILEAMKMEHQIEAPVAGRVAALHARGGDQVGIRQVLVEIVADGPAEEPIAAT